MLLSLKKLSHHFLSTFIAQTIALKMLKTHIKIHLASNFIQFFKYLAKILIFLNPKPNSSFYFCINY